MKRKTITRALAAGWFGLLALTLLPLVSDVMRIGLSAACNGSGGGCG